MPTSPPRLPRRISGHLTPSMLNARSTASCTACSPANTRPSPGVQGTRQDVRQEFDGDSIGRIAESLERAGHYDVARRLGRVPPRRVLHVTFETTGLVSQHFVALHPADGPDDGVSPLA